MPNDSTADAHLPEIDDTSAMFFEKRGTRLRGADQKNRNEIKHAQDRPRQQTKKNGGNGKEKEKFKKTSTAMAAAAATEAVYPSSRLYSVWVSLADQGPLTCTRRIFSMDSVRDASRANS